VDTYSSRGPTRSFDASTGRYDNVVKPDLVATGNHVVGPEAANNWIVTNYPNYGLDELNHGDYMFLNGTSMAAPVVSGIAALMLQANPGLTPSEVKAALMYTATTLPVLGLRSGRGRGQCGRRRPARRGPQGRAARGPCGQRAPLPVRDAHGVLNLGGVSVPWSRGYIMISSGSGSALVQAGASSSRRGSCSPKAFVLARGIAFSEGVVTSEESSSPSAARCCREARWSPEDPR